MRLTFSTERLYTEAETEKIAFYSNMLSVYKEKMLVNPNSKTCGITREYIESSRIHSKLEEFKFGEKLINDLEDMISNFQETAV
ncbi:hypothetical protein CL617_04745 [archaeon]|nr:hypothetical protein [archaeon]|tara:strand:- start:3447 stop:3698 length:252 start_codon:yes stop_codon:yes gene_type:complete